HAVFTGVLATAAMFLVARSGAAEPERAALVFAMLGLAGLAVNLRWRSRWLTMAASVVLGGFAVYLVHWCEPALKPPRMWALALLGHATAVLLTATTLTWLQDRRRLSSDDIAVFAAPIRAMGLISSFVAIVPLALAFEWSWLRELALCWLS